MRQRRCANRKGQHMAEFAMLLGLVALTAMAMQPLTRRALHTGLGATSDRVFGEPACEDDNKNNICDAEEGRALQIQLQREMTESGTEGFRRRTRVEEDVTGSAKNKDVQFRVIPQQ